MHATERIAAQIAVQNGCDFLVHDIEDEVVSDSFVQLLKSEKLFYHLRSLLWIIIIIHLDRRLIIIHMT